MPGRLENSATGPLDVMPVSSLPAAPTTSSHGGILNVPRPLQTAHALTRARWLANEASDPRQANLTASYRGQQVISCENYQVYVFGLLTLGFWCKTGPITVSDSIKSCRIFGHLHKYIYIYI